MLFVLLPLNVNYLYDFFFFADAFPLQCAIDYVAWLFLYTLYFHLYYDLCL